MYQAMAYLAHLKLETDPDFLALLTRKLFHSGFNKDLVNARWSSFEKAFMGFDPGKVAAMTEADIQRLRQDRSIVRHEAKIRATVANAQHFVAIAQVHGSWRTWLRTMRRLPYAELADTLRACLTRCGPNTIYYFLLEAGIATAADKPLTVK